MTDSTIPKTLNELTLGSAFTIEELVSRASLNELVTQVSQLFELPIRLFGTGGALLVDGAGSTPALHNYLGTVALGRKSVIATVEAVKSAEPGDGVLWIHPCPSGLCYAVSAIRYDGRRIGKTVVGPFLTKDIVEPPNELLTVAAELDRDKVRDLWLELQRIEQLTVARLVAHLTQVLDMVLFSGHRALLASNMHLASVRESYRELEEKTASLEQAYERLKDLDRLKSNFLATVSHELRTPLTSIIGYSEMLTAGIAGELSQEQYDFIATIQEKGSQLLELIKGLLDLTKLESGTLILRKSDTKIGALLEDVVQTFLPHARKKSIELLANYDAALPDIWGEPARLRQVLSNLTENAIKFTPVGGRVRLSAEARLIEFGTDEEAPPVMVRGLRRTAVEVRVSDTGIGIAPNERQRVFDAFYQVDSSSTREQGGTGLGLSIVKKLVDAHEGSVAVEENSPHGTVFVVTLPCRKASLVG